MDETKIIRDLICEHAEIPKKFYDVNINNIDKKNILPETLKAIESVMKYLDLKIYKKNIGVLLFGDIGAGKTMLAIIILKHLIFLERMEGKFIRMSDILDKIIKTNFNINNYLDKYKVILFDDLDKMKSTKNSKNSEWAAERIFSIFDNLINNEKIIISTTNCQKISELNDFFDSSVVSRIIGNSQIIQVKGNDYRIIKREFLIKGDK